MRFHYYPASIMNITHHFSPIRLQEIKESFHKPKALGEEGKSTHQLWYIHIKLQNTHADTQLALVDTGCTHTCMSEENWLQTDREDCAFSTCGGEAKGISQTITLKIVGQAIIHVYLFTEDHQLLRLRTRCLIVNQLSTPFFLGRDVFKNSKVMETDTT